MKWNNIWNKIIYEYKYEYVVSLLMFLFNLVPRVCLFAGYVVAYSGNEIGFYFDGKFV
jgi:hypothetical protein